MSESGTIVDTAGPTTVTNNSAQSALVNGAVLASGASTVVPPADMPPGLPEFVPPKEGEFDTATPEDLKKQFGDAFDQQHTYRAADESPRQSASDRMKAKVRAVLDAQPFHANHIHKSDLLAAIDALIDGPDDESGPGY